MTNVLISTFKKNRTTSLLLMSVFVAIAMVISLQGSASAVTINSSGIPNAFPNYYGNFVTGSAPGGCPNVDYVAYIWGSAQGQSQNPGQATASSATAGAVNLQVNVASAVCNRNLTGGTAAGSIIREDVVGSATWFQGTPDVTDFNDVAIPGLTVTEPGAGDVIGLNFGCIHFADMRYVKQCAPASVGDPNRPVENFPFQLSGLGSLTPGVHNVRVKVYAKMVVDTLIGGVHSYSCVNPVNQNQTAADNAFGTNCFQHTINIDFTLTKPQYPTYTLNPTVTCDINSGNVTFNISKSGPAAANNITVTRTVVLNNPDSSTTVLKNNEALSPNLNDGDFPYNEVFATGVTSGQSIDASITVNPGSRDGNNNLGPAITRSCPTTPVLSSKPYLRVYGHDTVTGLPYVNDDGSCSGTKNTAADIKTFTRISGNDYIGAGSQFAASAAGTITEFSSESLHSPGTATHDVPDGLTFGNDGTLGGDVAGYVGCLPDYLDFVDYKDSPYLVNNLSDSVQMGSSPKYGQIQYYNKDVNIVNDVIISGNPTWSSIQDLQSGITDTQAGTNILVVKGNVSIRPSVNRFDGIIIAVPDPVSGLGGIVNTCVPSGSNKYDQCINKLEINGAIIAKQVRFNRLNGDIRTAPANELPSGDIAEVINFPAENFLILSRSDTYSQISYKGKYDSIVGLPPIL